MLQGGISLHLRGNIQGFRFASSKFKYLRCITGRHDLPFFYDGEVELQRSFLNAFLRGDDDRGWTVPGKVPVVDLCLRQGEPPYNNAEEELKTFPRRFENEWPLARTDYQKWHLNRNGRLSRDTETVDNTVRYEAPKFVAPKPAEPTSADGNSDSVQFTTAAFKQPMEITGHPTVRLSLSLSSRENSSPSEIDVFVTLRHLNPTGKEGTCREHSQVMPLTRSQYTTLEQAEIQFPLSRAGSEPLSEQLTPRIRSIRSFRRTEITIVQTSKMCF